MHRAHSQPLRQAFALAYAMKARPTPALASLYFDALKRMLGDDPASNQNTNGPATAEGTACRKESTLTRC
jgi:hypothetical protein